MVKIKFYNDLDYDQVKEILQEASLYDEVWETRKNLNRKINRDKESILIAEDNNQIIGCVFIVEDGWNAFIWRLSVKKSYRKKGVGTMLLKKAEDIVKSRGIKEISLFVESKNNLLKKWYKNKNYIQTKNFTFMYKKLD